MQGEKSNPRQSVIYNSRKTGCDDKLKVRLPFNKAHCIEHSCDCREVPEMGFRSMMLDFSESVDEAIHYAKRVVVPFNLLQELDLTHEFGQSEQWAWKNTCLVIEYRVTRYCPLFMCKHYTSQDGEHSEEDIIRYIMEFYSKPFTKEEIRDVMAYFEYARCSLFPNYSLQWFIGTYIVTSSELGNSPEERGTRFIQGELNHKDLMPFEMDGIFQKSDSKTGNKYLCLVYK